MPRRTAHTTQTNLYTHNGRCHVPRPATHPVLHVLWPRRRRRQERRAHDAPALVLLVVVVAWQGGGGSSLQIMPQHHCHWPQKAQGRREWRAKQVCCVVGGAAARLGSWRKAIAKRSCKTNEGQQKEEAGEKRRAGAQDARAASKGVE